MEIMIFVKVGSLQRNSAGGPATGENEGRTPMNKPRLPKWARQPYIQPFFEREVTVLIYDLSCENGDAFTQQLAPVLADIYPARTAFAHDITCSILYLSSQSSICVSGSKIVYLCAHSPQLLYASTGIHKGHSARETRERYTSEAADLIFAVLLCLD